MIHNRKGEPVGDLKKEDFTLTERGKLQTISFFSVESTGRFAAPPANVAATFFFERFSERAGVPGNVTVILLQ